MAALRKGALGGAVRGGPICTSTLAGASITTNSSLQSHNGTDTLVMVAGKVQCMWQEHLTATASFIAVKDGPWGFTSLSQAEHLA